MKIASEEIKEYTKNLPTHERQFTFDKFNEECYIKMYIKLRKSKTIIPRRVLFNDIPKLKHVCGSCWNFYLNQRTKSKKSLDIKYGKKFEIKLAEFLNKIGINCKLEKKKKYPDIVIQKENKKIAYIEAKYLSAPFVKAYEKVPGRECYEGSTTLDVKKINAQRKLLESGEINVPVFYVYWLDYPCIKGVFYMPAEKVYAYADVVGVEWSRKEREGDYILVGDKKIKVGARKKIYLPLLEMGSFSELIGELRALINLL